jgi:hypothetical protein
VSSIEDHPEAERAARQVLSGKEVIKARAEGIDPVRFAAEHHGEDALLAEMDDAAAEPLEADSPADERALAAMDGADRVKAQERRQTPAAYLKAEYGVDARRIVTADAVREAVVDAVTEEDN